MDEDEASLYTYLMQQATGPRRGAGADPNPAPFGRRHHSKETRGAKEEVGAGTEAPGTDRETSRNRDLAQATPRWRTP